MMNLQIIPGTMCTRTNMQWPQIPQGINREQSQDSLHPFQIPPQNMGQMNREWQHNQIP